MSPRTEQLAADLADHGVMSRERAAELLVSALRCDVAGLRIHGVSIRPPWWRRKVQARLRPRRYQLWMQRQVLDQLDQVR